MAFEPGDGKGILKTGGGFAKLPRKEADFLAELSALEAIPQLPEEPVKKAPPPREPAERKASKEQGDLVQEDFLSDIRAFRAKPKPREEAPAPPRPPVQPQKVEAAVRPPAPPRPAPAPEKPAPKPDLDIPEIPEIPEVSYSDDVGIMALPTPGADRKKRPSPPAEDLMSELADIRRQFEEGVSRLRALEGGSAPVKIGAMGGLELSPAPYSQARQGAASMPDASIEAASPRDKRTIRRDVDDILQGAARASLQDEVNAFNELVRAVQGLNYLHPRMAEIMDRGEMSPNVLLAMYRLASRFLQAEIAQKEQTLEASQNDFKKYKDSMKKLGSVLNTRKEMPGMAGYDDSGGGEGEGGEAFVLRETVKKKDQQIDQYEKRVESMKADFDNFRQRQKKDVDRLVAKSREDMILDLIGVVDNFERAISTAGTAQSVDVLIAGFQMIHDNFLKLLSRYGLEEIEAENLKFDPHYHEAMMREESTSHPDGTVIEVLRKGYILGDKMIRAAQVKTSFNPRGS
jgi:molecular chaperone GrpE